LALTALSLLLLALNLSHPDAYVYEFWDGDTLVALSFSIISAIILPPAFPPIP
jgi:hypothetical protein